MPIKWWLRESQDEVQESLCGACCRGCPVHKNNVRCSASAAAPVLPPSPPAYRPTDEEREALQRQADPGVQLTIAEWDDGALQLLGALLGGPTSSNNDTIDVNIVV